MSIEKAIESVLSGTDQIAIRCINEKNRNVLRTTAFRVRRKMSEDSRFSIAARNIGISNEEINGEPFLRIYLKEDLDMFIKDDKGNWMLMVSNDAEIYDTEGTRMLGLMVKDGRTDNEIFAIMKSNYNWKVGEITEKLELLRVDTPEPIKRDKLKLEDL